jgi:hypothetical protein
MLGGCHNEAPHRASTTIKRNLGRLRIDLGSTPFGRNFEISSATGEIHLSGFGDQADPVVTARNLLIAASRIPLESNLHSPPVYQSDPSTSSGNRASLNHPPAQSGNRPAEP